MMNMRISNRELEDRLSRFKRVCRESGRKLTQQRLEIFREVARTGDHPDVESVYRRVRKQLPTVSLDTVYRTLWMLKDLGLVNTLESTHSRTRFDANLERHHHFVCTGCGMTVDFEDRGFDKLTIPDSVKSMGDMKELQVEVRGLCKECASKKESK